MPPPFELVERTRHTKAGWRLRDLDRLYVGFGFERVEGARHTLYVHPSYPELRATVTRSDPPPIGYVVHATRLAVCPVNESWSA